MTNVPRDFDIVVIPQIKLLSVISVHLTITSMFQFEHSNNSSQLESLLLEYGRFNYTAKAVQSIFSVSPSVLGVQGSLNEM